MDYSDGSGGSSSSSQFHGQQQSSRSALTSPARKKRSRIDSFAAALAKSRTNTQTQQQQSNPDNEKEKGSIGVKSSAQVGQGETTRKCSVCNSVDVSDETLLCVNCSRKSPLFGGDATLTSTPLGQEPMAGNVSDEELAIINAGANEELVEPTADFRTTSSQGYFVEQYSSVSTMENPTPTTGSNSGRESRSPTPQPEGTCSDNDEYQPPGSARRATTESTRGGRGKGKGKKPANTATGESSRQATMKTRFGGKPPTTSYASKFAYQQEQCRDKFEGGGKGKKSRGKGAKGKGSYRGRRNTTGGGRGGKLVSMYTAALSARRESGQREASEDSRKVSSSSPDKNDYIRTAVVTSVKDKYMAEYPRLCLICGSIGKSVEGTMISCMSCAQSFHTYCVSIHDKLNLTLLKRGWRCLDCTICEGCGSGEDESNLLLCDGCDISYHIYCLDPPLQCIPQGSWRCKSCSACTHCNRAVKPGVDLQRSEGLCEVCFSLRKCPKCCELYEIGDLMLKCQHCMRWFHGRCEGHSSEEQLENVAENAFRCSFCRPQSFNDVFNMPVIVDNVMVSKSVVEQLHGHQRRLSALLGAEQFGGLISSRSFSNEQGDSEFNEDPRDQQFIPNLFSMRGRGGGTRGGPGRRVLKLGVGGFNVRNPKNRGLNQMAADEEFPPNSEDPAGLGPNGKPRIRRPRKLRKPLLEDAYPANIQESFFGVPAVESRSLAEQCVDEPNLMEHRKMNGTLDGVKTNSELSEHSAELLRNEQEMDMLGDIPLVDDIGLDMDIENLDFTDLVAGDGEDDGADDSETIDEAFNAGSSTSLQALQQTNSTDICSPSSAESRNPSRMNESAHFASSSSAFQRRPIASEIAKPIEQQRQQSAAALAAERWEEDEPLGDKATKAAVLYANVEHPYLKEKYPVWSDRVKQINKAWRELSGEKRQEFVEWARKNRVNCPTPRRRARRTITQGSTPTTPSAMVAMNPQQKQEIVQQLQQGLSSAQMGQIGQGTSGAAHNQIQQRELMEKMPVNVPPQNIPSNFRPDPSALSHFNQAGSNNSNQNLPQPVDEQHLQRTALLKRELEQEEEKIEQMKKAKRALAARQRQLVKKEPPTNPDELKRREFELHEFEASLNAAKKAIQAQQKVVDRCRQRFKELMGPQAATAQNSQQFLQRCTPTLQQSPTTSHEHPPKFQPEMVHQQQHTFDMNPMQFMAMRKEQQHNFMGNEGAGGGSFASTPFSPLAQQPPQPKGQRGRKRKKPPQERSAVLGGIPFASLQTQLEQDVYDAVDGIVHAVVETTNPSANQDGPKADALFVKRILLSQQQQEQQAYLAGIDPMKTKKKRQSQQMKGLNQSDLNTEYEQLQERIKNMLSSLPPLTSSLEQYQAYDKHMLKYPHQTGLPEQGNEFSLSLLGDKEIGKLSLPFMPDFYEELEQGDCIDEEALFPPSMDEICLTVDLDAFEATLDEDDPISPIPLDDFKATAEADELELPFLSTDNIGDRAKLVKSKLLLFNSGPEEEVPIEPHWSWFEEAPIDLNRQVEVLIEVDPTKKDQLLENLQKLLGLTDVDALELGIETPPQTPASTANKFLPTATVQNVTNLMDSSDLSLCKNCGENCAAGGQQQQIEESSARLGLTNGEKEYKVTFCKMACYFKFISKCRIPLAVDLLEMAERCVDEETMEVLRQISVDDFAKRINAGQNTAAAASTTPSSTGTQQMEGPEEKPQIQAGGSNLISSLPLHVSNVGTLLEQANAPREFQLRSMELAQLVQQQQAAAKLEKQRRGSRDGFKWRGQWWNRCDADLIRAFQQQKDAKLKCTPPIQTELNTAIKIDHDDTRHCSFCGTAGDGDAHLTGRLLNVDANEWAHVNCALWSAEVHVSEEGALMNVETALRNAQKVECKICGRAGASIRCYKLDCADKDFAFHLLCAKLSNGKFVKDKTFFCANHEIRPDALVTRLDTFTLRRLFVHRDENQLLSKIFNNSYTTDEMLMRVGSLIFHKVGQLLPEQLKRFTTAEHIFPVGYMVTRIFWSLSTGTSPEHQHYQCTIEEHEGVPEFVVRNLELGSEFRGATPTEAWASVQQMISQLRDKLPGQMLRFFPNQINGETVFGFTEPSISKMLESLPGIDQLFTYIFKHGGTPLMELPLAENPSGSARCEPCFRTLVKRKHRPIISNSPKKDEEKAYNNNEAVVSREGRVRSTSSRFTSCGLSQKIDQEMLRAYKASGISERMLQAPHLRNNEAAQLLAQYREMKKEWRENIYLARSKIQGLGLYAKRDLDMNQMIIEYIGEMIRNEVCEMRQRHYIEQNRGEYMFRVDGDWVVDATMSGGLARYINHSCDPNCGTKILTMNEEKKIVIMANRPIKAGEELTYDYSFDIEDTTKKIPCLCGAPNCARWMN